MTGSTWWTRTACLGGVVALALLLIGALGARVGVWAYTSGFLVAAAGIAVAALAAAWGIGALLVALHRSLRAELSALALGLVSSALVLGAFALQFARLQSAPPIYQVTTDTDDPPMFDAVATMRPAGSNPHTYDPDQPIGDGTLAGAQKAAWPELTSLRSPLDPDAALDRAVETAEDMGMAVVNVDRANGIVEATATTFWFGFTDDVVVRVRGDADGSVIDARSVSRVGLSDVGANARRLLRFLEAFAEG